MMLPEEVPEALRALAPYMAEVCEVSLADWQDNPNSGAWVKFRLPDETHLEIYRGKNRAGRTQKWGQRYQMMLIEINDDETPMQPEQDKQPKPMKLSQIAGALCHDEKFRAWCVKQYGDPCPDEAAAAQLIREVCAIDSRALLDVNQEAASVFRELLADYDKFKDEPRGAAQE